MLSLPDLKEKQLLFIRSGTNSGDGMNFSNGNLVYTKKNGEKNKISCYKLLAVFVFGEITISSGLIKNAVKHGVSIFLLNESFQVYAEIGSKAEGNYFLREKQYFFSSELFVSKKIVKNKILNQFFLLKQKDKIKTEILKERKNEFIEKIEKAKNIDSLRGIEGNVAKIFFGEYFSELGWLRRMPRAKIDHWNILLDIGYSLLFNCIDSLLRLFGFDVYKGIYHQLFFQRKSLSCDLMEPFRCIIEKQLLKSYRLGQINEKDFKFSNGRYFLKYKESRKYAKIFLQAIMKNKEDIYLYVKGFYGFMLDEKKDFPNFKIK